MVVFRSGDLCRSIPTSRTIMNIRALMIDAPAPVAKEYMVQMVMQTMDLSAFALGQLPVIDNICEIAI